MYLVLRKRHMSTPHTAMIMMHLQRGYDPQQHDWLNDVMRGRRHCKESYWLGYLGVAITIMLLEHYYSHCRCTRPIFLPSFSQVCECVCMCTIGLGPFLGVLLRPPLFPSFLSFSFPHSFSPQHNYQRRLTRRLHITTTFSQPSPFLSFKGRCNLQTLLNTHYTRWQYSIRSFLYIFRLNKKHDFNTRTSFSTP